MSQGKYQSTPPLPIIYEDAYLFAINKPPGLLSQEDKSGDPDVYSLCQQHLANQPNTSQYVALLHRLDRPVGGIMLLGKNKNTSARLSEQFKQGTIQKTYFAVIKGVLPKNGVLTDYLVKDREKNKVRVTTSDNTKAKYAELAYQRMEIEGDYTLIKIHLITGRSHQIRIQLSNEGFPILGDHKYGGESINNSDEHQIALYSHQLTFHHPDFDEEMKLSAALPEIYPWNLFNILR